MNKTRYRLFLLNPKRPHYRFWPGARGNYISTPSNDDSTITSDLTFIWR